MRRYPDGKGICEAVPTVPFGEAGVHSPPLAPMIVPPLLIASESPIPEIGV